MMTQAPTIHQHYIHASFPVHLLMTCSACFISDLHLLSPRSLAERWMPAIHAACRDSQLIVLGGDIFDFRWANLGSHQATLDAARHWLTELVTQHAHAHTAYIMGNHDSHPDMQSLLMELTHQHDNFQWQPETWRIADCLFCHGDVLDAGSRSQLASYRRRFQHERPASQTAHRLYNAAVAMRLHRTLPKLFHRPRATCTRLYELLDIARFNASPPNANGLANASGVANGSGLANASSLANLTHVERVFFGHTHVPIYDLPLGGIHYYNPGAALRHMNFAPIQFEINVENSRGLFQGTASR